MTLGSAAVHRHMSAVTAVSYGSGVSPVILHLDPESAAPLGVWWRDPDGEVRHHYVTEDGESLARGRERVADTFDLRTRNGVGTPDEVWAELAGDLAAASTYSAWWEVIDEPTSDALAILRDAVNRWMAGRFGTRVTARLDSARGRARYGFATQAAGRIAAAILDEPSPAPVLPGPRGRISQRIVPFVNAADDVLAVTVGSHEQPRETQLALPYSLALLGERQLRLAVPAGTEWPTLARLAFIEVDARLWIHQDDDPATLTEIPIPLRSTVLDTHDDRVVAAAADLGDRATWIAALEDWADAHREVVSAHRSSYLAWHCRGRSVLEVRRSATGLRVKAGVISDDPTYADGIEREIAGPAEPVDDLIAAAETAIAQRLDGSDAGHVEHRFQARLAHSDMAARLELAELHREFPAFRPGAAKAGRGYIDFLAAGQDGALHVVETKIGHDPMIALQALDYVVWTEAHREVLASLLGTDPERRTTVDFVIMRPERRTLVDEFTKAALSRLPRSVRWRMFEAVGDLDGVLAVERVGAARVTDGDRWVNRVHRRVESAAAIRGDGVSFGWYPEPSAGFVDGTSQAVSAVVEGGHAHSHLAHVRSSQRFALNLFGALDEAGAAGLLARWFGAMDRAELPVLEWIDPDDHLAEATASRPHQTQVDVFLDGLTADDRRVAALIEVKLTETGFGGCSHAEVAPAAARTPCTSEGGFGGDPTTCWQLRNRDDGPRRRYDEHLTVQPVALGGCSFRRLNQPMRLAALAGALEELSGYDEVVVLLTTPQGHAAVHREWRDAQALFGARLDVLEPADVAGVLPASAQEGVLDLYGVAATPRDPIGREQALIEARTPLGWQLVAEIMRRHPDLCYAVTHPGGGTYHCMTLTRGDEVVVDLNLLGSLHVPGGDSDPAIWDRLATTPIVELVDEIEARTNSLFVNELRRGRID